MNIAGTTVTSDQHSPSLATGGTLDYILFSRNHIQLTKIIYEVATMRDFRAQWPQQGQSLISASSFLSYVIVVYSEYIYRDESHRWVLRNWDHEPAAWC